MLNQAVRHIVSLALLSPILVACSSSDDDDSAGTPLDGSAIVGAVYAMDNGETVNNIVAYARANDGSLSLVGSTATEGQGTGPNNVASGPGGDTVDPLASNYSLQMSSDNQFLFAVNAGSDQISSFSVNADMSLTHVSTVASGGGDPVSIATSGSTLFVANTNTGVGDIAPFSIGADGTLSSAGESIALNGRPTAIVFSPDSNSLVAALVDTNQLQVFSVSGTSLSQTQLFTYPSSPEGRNVANPFGLSAYERGGAEFLLVGEARVFDADGNAAPQTSSVSTFSLSGGAVTPVNLDMRTDADNDDTVGPITSCWAITNDDGTLGFTSNTFSNNLSSFTLDDSGNATLSVSAAFQDPAEDFNDVGFTDQMAIGSRVYQLAGASGEIIVFEADATTGALTEIDRESSGLSLLGGNQGITGF